MPEMGYIEYYSAKKQKELGNDICVTISDRHITALKNIGK
jgi:hypothetical protein